MERVEAVYLRHGGIGELNLWGDDVEEVEREKQARLH